MGCVKLVILSMKNLFKVMMDKKMVFYLCSQKSLLSQVICFKNFIDIMSLVFKNNTAHAFSYFEQINSINIYNVYIPRLIYKLKSVLSLTGELDNEKHLLLNTVLQNIGSMRRISNISLLKLKKLKYVFDILILTEIWMKSNVTDLYNIPNYKRYSVSVFKNKTAHASLYFEQLNSVNTYFTYLPCLVYKFKLVILFYRRTR